MATVGSYDLNLTKLGNTTNNTTGLVASVTEELANRGDLIGLGIAISISLVLIFGAIMVAVNFVPRLIGKVKGLRSV